MSGVGRHLLLTVAVMCAATPWAARHAGAQDGTALHGRITLLMPNGSTAPAVDAVVMLAGASRSSAAARPTMSSQGKRFVPHVIAVPSGTTVEFPNVDRIFHNAFSVSPGNQFDLGLYRKGASKSVPFAAPGVVRVYCNIHQDMAGYVIVHAPGASAVTDTSGSFRLQGLRPGRQQVRVWHEMGGESEAFVDLAPGQDGVYDLQLDARRFRREPHLNKDGRPYPPVRRDADRY